MHVPAKKKKTTILITIKGGNTMIFTVLYVAVMAVVCTKITETVDHKLSE